MVLAEQTHTETHACFSQMHGVLFHAFPYTFRAYRTPLPRVPIRRSVPSDSIFLSNLYACGAEMAQSSTTSPREIGP